MGQRLPVPGVIISPHAPPRLDRPHHYAHQPPFETIGGMARAGKALKQTLQDYGISQNRLAVTMGIARSTVHYWFNETQDPQSDAIPAIVAALEAIEPAAARAFLEAYLGRSLTDWITPDPP